MDFDFVDDSRPRVQLQSQSGGGKRLGQRVEEDDRSTTSRSLGKVSAGVCASLGIGLVGLGLRWVAGPLQFLAIWFGLSLVVGPFAPPSVTGGDCRVGVGEPVRPEFGDGEGNATAVERMGGRGGSSSRSKENYAASRRAAAAEVAVDGGRKAGLVSGGGGINNEQNDGSSRGITEGRRDAVPSRGRNGAEAEVGIVEEEDEREEEEDEGEKEKGKEWRSEDVDALKKLIVKHPRGTLRRWEVIAEALGGRYSADNVVKMSKALGQKKVAGSSGDGGGGGDQEAAYSKFLSQRKGSKGIAIASPLSQREGMDTSLNNEENMNAPAPTAAAVSKSEWTDAEDKALLTALKTFPKDSFKRWDKVAQAVPGRSKTQCFRRFSDLRESFRSSTGGTSSAQPESAID